MLPFWVFSSATAEVIRPDWLTEASAEPRSTRSRPPAPWASARLTWVPAARPTVPLAASRVPLFSTDLAISRISPEVAVMRPRFTTPASPDPEKVRPPPARKLASGRSRLEARKVPPVEIRPLFPTITPAGLMR